MKNMKKSVLVMLFTVFSISSQANDDVELTEASASYIQMVIEACKEYAVEDGIDTTDLSGYLLNCVNDDLEENDFKPLTSLPVSGN